MGREEIIEKKERNIDALRKILKREAYFLEEERKILLANNSSNGG